MKNITFYAYEYSYIGSANDMNMNTVFQRKLTG